MAVTAEQLREWVTNAPVEQSEVERRILASRHYYATFHKCRPLAEAQGLFRDAGGAHAEVIDALTRGPAKDLKVVGYKLEACRKTRVKADYRIDEEFAEAESAEMRQRCEEIWKQVAKFAQSDQGHRLKT